RAARAAARAARGGRDRRAGRRRGRRRRAARAARAAGGRRDGRGRRAARALRLAAVEADEELAAGEERERRDPEETRVGHHHLQESEAPAGPIARLGAFGFAVTASTTPVPAAATPAITRTVEP